MDNQIDELKDAEKEKLVLDSNDLELSEGTGAVATNQSNQNWVGGAILIGIGAVFLISQMTGFYLHNWWALFMLVPGIGKFVHGIRLYATNGRFSGEAQSALTWGAILTLVGCTFLFDLSWGLIWPFFLIIFGVAALLSGLLDRDNG